MGSVGGAEQRALPEAYRVTAYPCLTHLYNRARSGYGWARTTGFSSHPPHPRARYTPLAPRCSAPFPHGAAFGDALAAGSATRSRGRVPIWGVDATRFRHLVWIVTAGNDPRWAVPVLDFDPGSSRHGILDDGQVHVEDAVPIPSRRQTCSGERRPIRHIRTVRGLSGSAE